MFVAAKNNLLNGKEYKAGTQNCQTWLDAFVKEFGYSRTFDGIGDHPAYATFADYGYHKGQKFADSGQYVGSSSGGCTVS